MILSLCALAICVASFEKYPFLNWIVGCWVTPAPYVFRISILISCIVCKYFLPSWLIISLAVQMRLDLFTPVCFCFMLPVFLRSYPRSLCLGQSLVFPMLSSSNLMASGLRCVSLIPNELIFVWCVRYDFCFKMLHVEIHFCQFHLLRRLVSARTDFSLFVKDDLVVDAGINFKGFCCVSLATCLYCAGSRLFGLWLPSNVCWNQLLYCLQFLFVCLFSFNSDFLVILGTLCFHIQFRIRYFLDLRRMLYWSRSHWIYNLT